MTTLFDLLTEACGLSQREAADFLRVRLDTVKSWASGRRQPPVEALTELAALRIKIETAAAEMIAQIDRIAEQRGSPDEIELGIASDNAEAQNIGWPCVGAQRAALAIVAARLTSDGRRVRTSPRGSTVALAAAADAHEAR